MMSTGSAATGPRSGSSALVSPAIARPAPLMSGVPTCTSIMHRTLKGCSFNSDYALAYGESDDLRGLWTVAFWIVLDPVAPESFKTEVVRAVTSLDGVKVADFLLPRVPGLATRSTMGGLTGRVVRSRPAFWRVPARRSSGEGMKTWWP